MIDEIFNYTQDDEKEMINRRLRGEVCEEAVEWKKREVNKRCKCELEKSQKKSFHVSPYLAKEK